MTTIPLCLMSDKNYVMPTTVMLKSLYLNKNQNTIYDIYIIADNMDDETISVFEKQSKDNFSVKVINIDNPYKNFENKNPNMSCTTFLKFEIPTLLEQYDKVLYLDTDTIVLKDLSELYNTDLKDTYSGVVRDFYLMKNKDHIALGLKNYFNAGVMLFNSKKIREDFPIDIFGKTYVENSDKLLHHDQDVFNILFNDNITILPPKYNWMVSNKYFFKNEITKFHNISKSDMKVKNLSIIHYTTGLKPWKYKYPAFNSIWHYYYKKAGFDLKKLNLKSGFVGMAYLHIRNSLNLSKIDPYIKRIINRKSTK